MMSETEEKKSLNEQFIKQLEALQEGERSRLRRLAGQPLDQTLPGFDLFTGLWWPLRAKNQRAPRRETAWLVAKLFGAFPIPPVRDQDAHLPTILGRREPLAREKSEHKRYRDRFDALLESPLASLEPHLRWSLTVVADAVKNKRAPGLDWAALLDDLSIWDRSDEHRRKRDIRDIWAEQYLNVDR